MNRLIYTWLLRYNKNLCFGREQWFKYNERSGKAIFYGLPKFVIYGVEKTMELHPREKINQKVSDIFQMDFQEKLVVQKLLLLFQNV